jgi:hypothetical protein
MTELKKVETYNEKFIKCSFILEKLIESENRKKEQLNEKKFDSNNIMSFINILTREHNLEFVAGGNELSIAEALIFAIDKLLDSCSEKPEYKKQLNRFILDGLSKVFKEFIFEELEQMKKILELETHQKPQA